MTPVPLPALSRIHRLALAWGLLVAASAWAAALVLAPFVASGHERAGSAVTAGVLAYLLGGTVCHQHPARTFYLWGAPMPVCARCAGLYVGALVGIAAGVGVACRRRWRCLRDEGGESLRAWRIGLVVAAGPTAATFALEKVCGVTITNASRAAAGVILGAAVGWIAASSLRGREARVGGAHEVNYSHARSDGGGNPAA